jgi:hypothetical protein
VWIGDVCLAAARGNRKSELRRWGNRKAANWRGSHVRLAKHDSKRWRPVPGWQSSRLAMSLIGPALILRAMGRLKSEDEAPVAQVAPVAP